jgi:hypothetical protein
LQVRRGFLKPVPESFYRAVGQPDLGVDFQPQLQVVGGRGSGPMNRTACRSTWCMRGRARFPLKTRSFLDFAVARLRSALAALPAADAVSPS